MALPLLATLLLLFIPNLFSCHDAHSFLLNPLPYNQKYLTRSCRGSECFQACPNYDSSARYRSTSPIRTFRRGQSVTVRWARNNHEGGFMHLMLIPMRSPTDLSRLFTTALHNRLAFHYGCWSQGRYPCGTGRCGSDNGKVAYSTLLTIPRVYPDGAYIFAFVWYGGVKDNSGWYPDYRSCAFVRIRGGDSVDTQNGFVPKFVPGDDAKRPIPQKERCHTVSTVPGFCPNTGCRGPQYRAFYAVPAPFRNGRQPPPITYAEITRLAGQTANPVPSPSPSRSRQPAPSPSRSRRPRPSPSSSRTPRPTPSSSKRPRPSPSSSRTPQPSPSTSRRPRPTPSTSRNPSRTPRPSPSRSRRPISSPSGTGTPRPTLSESTSPPPSTSVSASASASAMLTSIPSPSASASLTVLPSQPQTQTQPPSPSRSVSLVSTAVSVSASASIVPSSSATISATASSSVSSNESVSVSSNSRISVSVTPSASSSQSETSEPKRTATETATPSPASVTASSSPSSSPSPSPSPSPSHLSSPSQILPSTASPFASSVPTWTATATATPSTPESSPPSPTSQPSPILPDDALCVQYNDKTVCCAVKCGVCSQSGCFNRSGGTRKCCPRNIARTARKCVNNPRAPCVA